MTTQPLTTSTPPQWTPPAMPPGSVLPPWAGGPPAIASESDEDDDEPSPFSVESGPADYTVDDDGERVWIALDGMLFCMSVDTLMTYRSD